MSTNSWKFVGSVPENYQRYLVPVLFAPYAEDMARRIAGRTEGEVLETACGTGALTRVLRKTLPTGRHLVATDFSTAMLQVAQAQTPPGGGIEWQAADAAGLPFDAGRFGAVACQFGMAFMPDPAQALREARRVLAPGGSLCFSVWDFPSANVHSRLFDEVCKRFAGDAISPAEQDKPYSLSDRNLLRQLVLHAGFATVAIETVSFQAVSPTARDWALGAITGTPRALQLTNAGVALEPVVDALAEGLAAHGGAAPCRTTMHAVVVTAA
ncbi:MAG: methyltransferase domain-containing protein [Pseudomonadota bacterium]